MKHITFKIILTTVAVLVAITASADSQNQLKKAYEVCAPLAVRAVESKLDGLVDDDDIYIDKCSLTERGAVNCFVNVVVGYAAYDYYRVALNDQCSKVKKMELVQEVRP